jgi:hypothetical protein
MSNFKFIVKFLGKLPSFLENCKILEKIVKFQTKKSLKKLKIIKKINFLRAYLNLKKIKQFKKFSNFKHRFQILEKNY